MNARYYELCDRTGMMQKLGRDWIIEQVDELAINFGRQHFRWHVTQGSVNADRAMTDTEIQDRLSRFLQQDQGEVGRNVAAHMRHGQCDHVHSGVIKIKQQLNQSWLDCNRLA